MPRNIDQGTYLEGLLKNIPSEAIGSYLAVMSFMTVVPDNVGVWLHWVVFVIFLGTVPIWLKLGNDKIRWWQIVFACLSFVIWAMTLVEGPFYTLGNYQAWIGGIFLLLFSGVIFPLLSKLFVKVGWA